MRSLLPEDFPISIAGHIDGKCNRDFRQYVVAPGLVELNERGRIPRASLERYLGFEISAERYLAADRRRDSARQYQQRYREAQKESENVTA